MPSYRSDPLSTDEYGLLLGWLAFHRDALAAKCEGLDAEQLARMSVPPSRLSLLGLVRHMIEMERSYIRNCVGGENLGYRYCTDDDPDADFEGVAEADPAADLAEWRDHQARSDLAIATIGDPDAICPDGRTLRWYVLKVIGEYSRHNGHADLLRETIDGATGE